MSEYIGKICPFCRTAFTKEDEVVLCSACDMPHHKECWIENQGCTTFGCIGTIQGIDGTPNTVTNTVMDYSAPAPASVVYCITCGNKNNATAAFCVHCGQRMHMPAQRVTYQQAQQHNASFYSNPQTYQRPVQPQYGQPQYGQPQYGQPQYGQPQYGQPQYGQPQYGQPQYGQPQYRQPQYGQPQYGQPQYGRPQYAPPRYAQPQPQYGQPQYAQPRYGTPQNPNVPAAPQANPPYSKDGNNENNGNNG